VLCLEYGERFDGTNHDEALREARSYARFVRWMYQGRAVGTPEQQERWIRDDPNWSLGEEIPDGL
jgi:inhibitor of KinA sporulation pathway (predicted exonuclease)